MDDLYPVLWISGYWGGTGLGHYLATVELFGYILRINTIYGIFKRIYTSYGVLYTN